MGNTPIQKKAPSFKKCRITTQSIQEFRRLNLTQA